MLPMSTKLKKVKTPEINFKIPIEIQIIEMGIHGPLDIPEVRSGA
jgi:hypothetical protein